MKTICYNLLVLILRISLLIVWLTVFMIGLETKNYLMFPIFYLACGLNLAACCIFSGYRFDFKTNLKIILFWLPGLVFPKMAARMTQIKSANDDE